MDSKPSVIWSCERCGYTTPIKCNLKKHLLASSSCSPSLSDIPVQQLLDTHFPPISKHFTCDHCHKPFAFFQGKYRHQKFCKNRQICRFPSRVLHISL